MIRSVKVLPEDAGPWLREEFGVPVYWDFDLDVRLGTARTRVEPDGLYADVVVTDDAFYDALKSGFVPTMAVHGKVAREHMVGDVRVIDEVQIVSITCGRTQ